MKSISKHARRIFDTQPEIKRRIAVAPQPDLPTEHRPKRKRAIWMLGTHGQNTTTPSEQNHAHTKCSRNKNTCRLLYGGGFGQWARQQAHQTVASGEDEGALLPTNQCQDILLRNRSQIRECDVCHQNLWPNGAMAVTRGSGMGVAVHALRKCSPRLLHSGTGLVFWISGVSHTLPLRHGTRGHAHSRPTRQCDWGGGDCPDLATTSVGPRCGPILASVVVMGLGIDRHGRYPQPRPPPSPSCRRPTEALIHSPHPRAALFQSNSPRGGACIHRRPARSMYLSVWGHAPQWCAAWMGQGCHSYSGDRGCDRAGSWESLFAFVFLRILRCCPG